MKDHFIICGIGTTGYHCLDELLRTKRPCVVIDMNRAKLDQVTAELGEFPFIVGSPDNDDVLRQAGVERAQGLVASLADDKENLYVTLSARALNPDLRIISEVRDNLARPKLLKAGASSVVNPTSIGGLRMVSELVRPAVVTFLDSMLRDRQDDYRFEELLVASGCAVDGKTLGALGLVQKVDVLIVAIQLPGDARFTYHPKPESVLPAGTTVVLMGQIEEIVKLRPDFALPE